MRILRVLRQSISTLFTVCVAVTICATKVALAENQALTEAEYRNLATWDAVSMTLMVNLTGSVPIYSGTMRLKSSVASTHGPVLILNGRDVSMKMLDVKISNPEAVPEYSVVMNVAAPGERKATLSAIRFVEPIPAATEIEISFDYEFVTEQGQVIHRPELEYASWVTGWYPTPIGDGEGLRTIESLSSSGQVSFVLPRDWHVLSNGRLIEDTAIGNFRQQTWSTDDALAWSYIAAPFTVSTVNVGDVDVSMYMLNDDHKAVDEMASMIAKIIDLLEDNFGNYPFKTFGLAEIPDLTSDYFGASSEQGFIVAESKNFTNRFGLTLFSHEVGHAWWGNKFSCTGDGSSLCSEAMAQIGTILGTELLFGEKAMRDMMEVSEIDYTPYQSARGFFAMWRSDEAIPLSEVSGWHIHRLMDSKGMWFWQMLREEVGDEKFFGVLRSLSGGELVDPTLVELEDYFSQETDQDLSVFFDQWLNRAGAPVINMEWHGINPVGKNEWRNDAMHETIIFANEEGQKQVSITLTQEQKELYKLNPEVRLEFFRSPAIVRTLDLSERQQTYVFDVEGMIKNVVLDPEHKILMWRPAYGPKPDLN